MVFYDQHGRPVAYSEDSTHIYLFTGEPVAYLDGDVVYGYNGKHYGWWRSCKTRKASPPSKMRKMR